MLNIEQNDEIVMNALSFSFASVEFSVHWYHVMLTSHVDRLKQTQRGERGVGGVFKKPTTTTKRDARIRCIFTNKKENFKLPR